MYVRSVCHVNVLLEGSLGRGDEGQQEAPEAGAGLPASTAVGPQKLMVAFRAFLIKMFLAVEIQAKPPRSA